MPIPDLAQSTLEAGDYLAPITKHRNSGRSHISIPFPDIQSQSVTPRPFLKWAGGKRSLLSEIRMRMPEFDGKYIEPFLGAGAVMFDQNPMRTKIVSDFNRDLIEVYEVIRDNPAELIAALRSHVNTERHYYEVRAWDREPDFREKNTKVQRAARFCFLNRLTYNGLYRVNSQGFVNSPYGKHANPDWVQEAVINSDSEFLRTTGEDGKNATTFLSGDYKDALKFAELGDWVYLDPPYAGTFTSYQSGGFTLEHQQELRDAFIALTKNGIPGLLSNSDVPVIHDLYGDKKLFEIEIVSVRRAIGSSVSSRGQVNEVMINNYRTLGIARG